MAVVKYSRRPLVQFSLVACMLLSADLSCAKKKPPQATETPKPPIDRMLEPQPKHRRPVRPVKDPRHVEILDVVWDSPLGKTFFSYMFGSPPEEATSRNVVDRVLSGGGKAVTKMSALQLMIEELYDNELMGEEQKIKLDVLRGDLLQRQMDLATHPTENIAYIASTALLTLLPFGYPPSRHALLKALARLPNWLKTKSLRESTRNVPNLWEGAKTYEVKWVIGTFFKYFGPFSFLYFFWFDWKESTRGHSIPYSIETLKSESEYREFLDDLRDL